MYLDHNADRTRPFVSNVNKATTTKAPDDAALAWELATTAQPYMRRVEADRIYIAIGIGETFEAIHSLITVIAREKVPVNELLAAAVSAWLDCYIGQPAEPGLRALVAEVDTHPPQHPEAAQQLPSFGKTASA